MTGRPQSSRPYGQHAADLEIDFGGADRPELVTALLARCAAPADDAHWWRQPVGARTAALLALLQATEGRPEFEATLRCPACGARFEIALPLERLAPDAPAASTVTVARSDGEALQLRRPTGEDTRAFGRLRHAGRELASIQILAALSVAGEPRPEDVQVAAEALSAADPLLAFSVECACPECGDAAEREVDLEGIALQRLARRQDALLREVHALASRYGWSEAQILAVAPARRARYLELIEGWQ